ncbi:MAG: HNH endonuclease [Pseudomonadota bacterium]
MNYIATGSPLNTDGYPLCPLCERPIPAHAKQSVHHLVPRLKGGKGGETVRLHQICHNAIHAHFAESELARDYSTIEKLLGHDSIKKFVAWVRKKDPAFHAPTRLEGGRSGRRR